MSNDAVNKLTDTVTRTTAAIGVKTSVFVGSAKIKTQINTINKDISKLKEELGSLVFNLWEKNITAPDQVSVFCSRIKEKYDSIYTLEADISKLKNQEKEVFGDANKGDRDVAKQDVTTFICQNCSSVYNDPVKFCRKCGNKM